MHLTYFLKARQKNLYKRLLNFLGKHCSENVKKACVEFKQREQAKKQYDDDDKRSLKKKSS